MKKTDLRRRVAALLLMALTVSGAVAQNPEDETQFKPHFTWGAAAGASIDMTRDDMSTIDFDISFGMRRGWINFLGVGVEADVMVSNSCRSFPLYAELRTNFTDRPTVAFADFKVGACLNYLQHDHQQTGAYAFAGAGFNLARSRKYSSYLVMGYTFRQRRTLVGDEMTHYFKDIHYATVKIGVAF